MEPYGRDVDVALSEACRATDILVTIVVKRRLSKQRLCEALRLLDDAALKLRRVVG